MINVPFLLTRIDVENFSCAFESRHTMRLFDGRYSLVSVSAVSSRAICVLVDMYPLPFVSTVSEWMAGIYHTDTATVQPHITALPLPTFIGDTEC